MTAPLPWRRDPEWQTVRGDLSHTLLLIERYGWLDAPPATPAERRRFDELTRRALALRVKLDAIRAGYFL